MIEEIEELKSKILELEKKYCFVRNYKIINTLLDKLHLESMILSVNEIENNTSMYVVDNSVSNEVKVYKLHDEE